jgi:hypothetical protein
MRMNSNYNESMNTEIQKITIIIKSYSESKQIELNENIFY